MLILAAVLATAIDIHIAEPRVRVVAPLTDLRVLCRVENPVDACTEFLGEVLACECRRNGSQWNITARAQLVPYVYLSTARGGLEEHEKLHLHDLRAQLEEHLSEVTSRPHPDREACESAARFESATFILRMDLFRKRSNQRLH